MAIQQLAGGNNGIISFLFHEDGSGVDGSVVPEGGDFSTALQQLLGDYDESAGTMSAPANLIPGTDAELDTSAMAQSGAAADTQLPVAVAEPVLSEEQLALLRQGSPAADIVTVGAATPPLATANVHATTDEEAGVDDDTALQPEPRADAVLLNLQTPTAAPAGTGDGKLADPRADAGKDTNATARAAEPRTPSSTFNRGLKHLIGLAREVHQVSAAEALPAVNAGSPLPTAQLTGKTQPAGGKTLPPQTRAAANTAFAFSGKAALPVLTDIVTPEAFMLPEGALSEALPAALAQNANTASTAQQGMGALFSATATTAGAARSPMAPDASSPANTLQLYSGEPMGTETWVQDLGTRVEWLKDNHISTAELHLHPAELGSLEIRITSEDDTTTVSFVTQNAAAKDIIESTLPRLRELLANQGMQLDQSHVSQQSAHERKQEQGLAAQRNEAGRERDTAADQGSTRRSTPLPGTGQIDHYV
jgi:flagellar hook-length control protein FliK